MGDLEDNDPVNNSNGQPIRRRHGKEDHPEYIEATRNQEIHSFKQIFAETKKECPLWPKDKTEFRKTFFDRYLLVLIGLIEMLAAHDASPEKVFLTKCEKKELVEAAADGVAAFKDRLSHSSVRDFYGNKVETYIFDDGMWQEHEEWKWAGEQCGDCPPKEIKRATNYDIDHASRLVYFFDTYIRNKPILDNLASAQNVTKEDCKKKDQNDQNVSFELTEEDCKKVAMHFAYKVFTGDFRKPLFNNFSDGTNGWHKFQPKDGAGFAPYDYSKGFLYDGYTQFRNYVPEIQWISDSVLKMIESSDKEISEHRSKIYESQYKNCQRMYIPDLVLGASNDKRMNGNLWVFLSSYELPKK